MKDFFKYVLATIVGIILVGVIAMILTVVSVMTMALTDNSVSVKSNSVMVVKLQGEITERKSEDPISELMKLGYNESFGLNNFLDAVDKAKTNDDIKGIYIEAGNLMSATPAALQEMRNKLLEFKKTGKFVLAYADSYTQGAYYVCSAADSVVINPQGMLEWQGLSSSVMYYKDALDKLGVKMQVFKVGTYKSAVEPFITNSMSEANREQITTYQQEIWSAMRKDVAQSRKLNTEKLNALADSGIVFSDAKIYLKEKLVDKLAYSDYVPNIICNMMKDIDDPDDYNTISMDEVASLASKEPKDPDGNIIAVYYAEGEIVENTDNNFSTQAIIGKKVVKDLQELAEDEDVKAVVLRVNSPGGSAYASEQIWHQVVNIKSKKPIIVSMGGLAASGGYYISCAADWIVAEPTTITGSIGIFGIIPEASELVNNKLGLKVETVKTNKYGSMDIFQPLDNDEGQLLQAYVNRGYELFTKRVADGRKKKQDYIKTIGEGRVWTGVHAKEIGLVDQLGSLDDAIKVAKQKAKVENYSVLKYPEVPDFFSTLFNDIVNNDNYADKKMKENFGELYDFAVSTKRLLEKDRLQAAMPYYIRFNL